MLAVYAICFGATGVGSCIGCGVARDVGWNGTAGALAGVTVLMVALFWAAAECMREEDE